MSDGVQGDIQILNKNLRVVLIGGTSHAGKSTLAQALATQLGWECISTDSLARHPGRPWKTLPDQVPAHVTEHYLTLSVDELIDDVTRHYQSMWPKIETLIDKHCLDPVLPGLVLEGSALLPDLVATKQQPKLAALWLTASDSFLKERIDHSSQVGDKSGDERTMVEKFLKRSWRYNQNMLKMIRQHHLISVDVEEHPSLNGLMVQVMALLAMTSTIN